jgi:phospholipid/cholesterol/gamma-HCH transport system substrate-binding protein
MRGLSTELKVGLFSVLVITIMTFMTFKVGGLFWLKEEGNIYHIYFKNIAGLDEKTKLKIAGVDAGFIEKIELHKRLAKVTVRVQKGVQLFSDASASIKATGLLGDKYLEIKPGFAEPALRSGDTIKDVLEIVDIDDLVRKLSKASENISTLVASVNEALGTEDAKQSLRETVTNLSHVTANLNETIVVNDAKLRNTLDSIKTLTASLNELVDKNKQPITDTVGNLREFSANLKSDGPELIANLNKATRELKEMVEENKPAVKDTVESLNSITKKIDQGEGTFGKLVKDERLYENINKAAEGVEKTFGALERFRTFITFQAEYLAKTQDGKGYFYLTLQPRPDRYYILGVVGDPLGKVKTTETETTVDGVTVRKKEEKTKQEIEFTAQYAMRYKDVALRLGLTENTFGAGADYFFHQNRGKITVDAWDFSNDEEHSKSPHIKAGVDYFIFKNLFVSAGIDNILNSKWRGGYAGVGLRIEDQDLKYMLGSIPAVR